MNLKQYHIYLDKDFACFGFVDTVFFKWSTRSSLSPLYGMTLIHVMLYKFSLHGNGVPFDICRTLFFLACYLLS